MPQGTHSPFLGLVVLVEFLPGLSGVKETSAGTAPAALKSGAPPAGASVGVKPARAKGQFLALNAPEEI